MRAATWLAQQGVAVRTLCLAAEVPVDDVRLVAAERPIAEGLFGPVDPATPTLGVWHDGRGHPLPRTKRAFSALARGRQGGGAVVADLLGGRLHRGPTAEDWVRRWLGGRAWTELVHGWLDHRLAGPGARAPAAVARRLLGASADRWWRPRWGAATRAERRVGRILDSGGEVLTDVGVEAVEVEHGQVVGLRTEFGFEPIDGPLLTDLTPAELHALLDGADLVVPHPSMGERVHVHVEGDLDVDALLVLDGARRLVSVARAHDGSGVVIEAIVAPGEPLRGAPDAQVGVAIRSRADGIVVGMGAVVGVRREPDAVTCPRPSAEAPWEELVHRYASLGIQPIGETGWSLPVSPLDEIELLGMLAEGAVVATQRARWLRDGPPHEPWSPLRWV